LIEDRVAIVTGAGTGIGKATAIQLAENGFKVALLGRRLELLEEIGHTISKAGGVGFPVRADITQEAEVIDAFDQVLQNLGRVDVLFNNAGLTLPPVEIADLSLEQWNRMVGINLTGSFLCAREAVRLMKAQQPRGGRIINNGSISAHVPRPLSVAYTATKHAITGLTRSLSLEGRPYNIACGQIDIGNAQSDMTTVMHQGVLQANGQIAKEPTFDVRHVADAVAYMAGLPLDANVQFMTVMATSMPYIGRG